MWLSVQFCPGVPVPGPPTSRPFSCSPVSEGRGGNRGSVTKRRGGGMVRSRAVGARLMRDAERKHEPPAVAGLGFARHRLHQDLPEPPDCARISLVFGGVV